MPSLQLSRGEVWAGVQVQMTLERSYFTVLALVEKFVHGLRICRQCCKAPYRPFRGWGVRFSFP